VNLQYTDAAPDNHNRQTSFGELTMRKFLAAAMLALSLGQANAAPPSTESIDRLLALTKTESVMESMYGSIEQIMRQAMIQAVGDKPLSAEQKRAIELVPSKFVAVMRTEFTWAVMKPRYVQLYQETFEQEEIDGLIAFYGSPVGQAFTNKMPIVMQKSMNLAQTQLRSLLPKIRQATDEALKEAKLAN
jgi:hypothetical protein